MDQCGNRRGSFHRIGQPHIKRKLRRLAAGSNKKQQSGSGDDSGAFRQVEVLAGEVSNFGELKRSEDRRDEKHPENEPGIANAINDERLIRRVARRLPMKVKPNQQIRAQSHAFPPDKHEHIIICQDQREHREHEEIEVPKKSVVPPFMRHVPGRINMDQHSDPGYKQQPDARQWIQQKSGIRMERSLRPVRLQIIHLPGIGTEPGIKHSLEGLIIVRRSISRRVLPNRAASHQERQHHRSHANRAHRLLLQSPAKEKHNGGPNRRQQRDQIDVVEKHALSVLELLALSF